LAIAEKAAHFPWIILLVAGMAQLGNALAGQGIAPLAPLIQPELGLSKVQIGIFSSGFFIGSWGVLLIGGALIDRFGVRRMVSLGQAIIGISMLSMMATTSYSQAVVVMMLAGLGGGIVMPGTTKAISEWFSARARGTAMGLKQSAVPFAGVITASTLPTIGLVMGWRAAVTITGAVIAAGGLITLLYYKDAPRKSKAAEPRAKFRDGLRETIRNTMVWRVSVIGLLLSTVQLGLTAYLALYFKEIILLATIPDETARIVAAGGYLALCQAGGIFGRVFWGWFSDKFLQGRRLVVMATIAAVSALMSVVISLGVIGYPVWFLVGVVFVYGVTAIGWNGLQHVLITEVVGQKYAGTGVGLSMTMSNFGVIVGPPLFGFVADMSGSYQLSWLFLACLSTVSCIVAIFTIKREGAIGEA
jgi:ACS family hexuronate transporter-like MFS transporter